LDHFPGGRLGKCQLPDSVESATELTHLGYGGTNLLGTSVRHTASPAIIIQMWPNDGSPLFEVWDDSREIPEFPQTVSFDDLEAESGRGLSLVKQLSKDCGTVSAESPKGGKIVWFRL